MRALLPTGRPEPLAEVGEVAEPASASDEVVVAIEAFSINRGETFLLARSRPGWRPGKEIAGPVVCADADGGGPAPGDRVVGHPVRAGWRSS